jgi:hypothetical protein
VVAVLVPSTKPLIKPIMPPTEAILEIPLPVAEGKTVVAVLVEVSEASVLVCLREISWCFSCKYYDLRDLDEVREAVSIGENTKSSLVSLPRVLAKPTQSFLKSN